MFFSIEKGQQLMYTIRLIHEAEPQSRPVVITILARVVRQYIRPHFFKISQNKTKFKRE